MTDEAQDKVARALNADAVSDDPERIEKSIERARARIAVGDAATLALGSMWLALASLLAPVFAFIARHTHPNNTGQDDGDRQ